MLSGDAKWGALYGSDGSILPSHQENFGIAVVETLACCKPVLISNKVIIWREIIESGGGIVGDDTHSGVVGLLKKWSNLTHSEKTQMSLNAIKCFEQYFSVDSFAKKILDAVKY
jgi:glycosyltransferase involved in cell wall biosynthesis